MKTYFDEWFDKDSQYGNNQQEINDCIVQKYNAGYFEDDITKFLIDKYYLEDSEFDYVSDYVHNTITSEFLQ